MKPSAAPSSFAIRSRNHSSRADCAIAAGRRPMAVTAARRRISNRYERVLVFGAPYETIRYIDGTEPPRGSLTTSGSGCAPGGRFDSGSNRCAPLVWCARARPGPRRRGPGLRPRHHLAQHDRPQPLHLTHSPSCRCYAASGSCNLAVNNRLGPRPPVANDRLRHMLIGYARVCGRLMHQRPVLEVVRETQAHVPERAGVGQQLPRDGFAPIAAQIGNVTA